jgi:uncharacterized protein
LRKAGFYFNAAGERVEIDELVARAVSSRQSLPPDMVLPTPERRSFPETRIQVANAFVATSSGEDVPRNLAFLFSRNRLNVAISRAQCLAYLICSPRLLEARCRTIEEMELVNALCRLAEYAQKENS